MKLSVKSTLWTTCILVLVLANSVFALFTLRELNRINQLTAQDHEVRHNVRQLKDELTQYLALGLSTAITRDPVDARMLGNLRERVRSRLEKGPGPDVGDEIAREYSELEAKAQLLLEHEQAAQPGPVFTSMPFRNLFRDTMEQANRLAQRSDQLVAQERSDGESFYRRYFGLDLMLSLLTIFLVAARLITEHRDVLRPVQSLHELLQRQRRGESSARWEGARKDEIGQIGESINHYADELQRRQRERGEFIGSVAHDLKNPLSAISLNCELVLKRRAGLTEQSLIDTIRRIKDQSDQLRRLTDDLLQAAKDQRAAWDVTPGALELVALARETLDLFSSSQPDREFGFDAQAPSIEIEADRGRLSQVLMNLLSNASKYSPAGSRVEVVVGRTPQGAFIDVLDRGVGIPDERKLTIFEPFRRLRSGERMAEGAGLGLAIVRQIAQAHGGSIHVADRVGGGTAFRIELPRKAAARARGQNVA